MRATSAIAGIVRRRRSRCWLALPPAHARTRRRARSSLGVVAIALRRVRRSRGSSGASAGARSSPALVGIGLGLLLATRLERRRTSSRSSSWGTLLAATLLYATPLTFAALGGLFSERSGVVNIGLEGMMLTGAFFGIWGADKTGSWALGDRSSRCSRAALFALVHAFFAIHLRADQIVGGTAINFLALGITGLPVHRDLRRRAARRRPPTIPDVRSRT